MSDKNPVLAPAVLRPYLHFLHRAVEAQQHGKDEARSIWLEAAAQLHALDNRSIDMLMLDLIAHQYRDEAVALTEAIAQLKPNDTASHVRLGYALQIANRQGDALAPYRRALSMEPDFRHLRKNLALAIRASGGNPIDEMALLEHAVVAEPNDVDAWINLSDASLRCFNLERAWSAGRHAVELNPQSAPARYQFALVLKEAQYWDQAEQQAEAACQLAPHDAAMRSSLSTLQLLRGNYAQGWRGHESRWRDPASMRTTLPVFPAPRWQGEPLAGKTLLVWGEQGMGDLLQFCRFIPVLAERVHREGGRLIWDSFAQMGALLTRSFGDCIDGYTCATRVDALPAFDFELPLVSIPFILDTREATIPSTVPYLRPDTTTLETWRKRLAKEKRLKVGLAWTGSRDHGRNRFRRVGWERYAAAFQSFRDVAFYSLQPGAADDIEAARAHGLTIIDTTAEFTSFDDTAAFVGALDLVITVCTSVAHLAGALGQRTWVLLDVNPYWPWMLERRDSPWYPTATLYRQQHFGEWDNVMQDVTRDLQTLVEHHT